MSGNFKIMIDQFLIFGIPILVLMLNCLFTYSIYQLLKLIPQNNRLFPLWTLFPTILPFLTYVITVYILVFGVFVPDHYFWIIFAVSFIGYIFMWLIYPFGVGKSLKKHMDPDIQFKGTLLFRLGILLVLLPLGSGIEKVDYIFFIAAVIVWISYWVIVIKTIKTLKHKWKK